MIENYQQVAIETYRNFGEPSKKKFRARPLDGQKLATTMKVECSSKMRDAHPEGTVFLVWAKVLSREDGTLFLYTSFQWKYEILTRTQATEFISKTFK